MKITDINGREIKLGKTSITVKREDGKTCGVVRDVTFILGNAPRVLMDFVYSHRAFPHNLIRYVVKVDGEYYYLYNKSTENYMKEYSRETDLDYEDVKARCTQKAANAEKARLNGLKVIECDYYEE